MSALETVNVDDESVISVPDTVDAILTEPDELMFTVPLAVSASTTLIDGAETTKFVPDIVDASVIAPDEVMFTAPLEVTGEFTTKEPLFVLIELTDRPALICAAPVKFSEKAPAVIAPLALLKEVPLAVNEPAVRLIGAAIVISPSVVVPAMRGL